MQFLVSTSPTVLSLDLIALLISVLARRSSSGLFPAAPLFVLLIVSSEAP